MKDLIADAVLSSSVPHIAEMRRLLGLTQTRLAQRMGVDQSTLARMEQKEADGRVTIKALERAASAMDCRLVYAIVPRGGSIQALLDERAVAAARRIHRIVDSTMALENQRVSEEERTAAIQETADEILRNEPHLIWDDDDVHHSS